MIIALFGLSGSGKSSLSKKFCLHHPTFISASASKIISNTKHSISLADLNPEIVANNQHALIIGFSDFCNKHPHKNIIIEVHNLIETKDGIIDIDNAVFTKLNIDVACFLSPSPFLLYDQRRNDKNRARFNLSVQRLTELQNKSRDKFEATSFKGTQKLIIEDNFFNQFSDFMHSIPK